MILRRSQEARAPGRGLSVLIRDASRADRSRDRLMKSTRARRARRRARRRADGRRASYRLSHRSRARHLADSRARRCVPSRSLAVSIVGYALAPSHARALTIMSAPATRAVAPTRAKASPATATSRRRALATFVAVPMTMRASSARANDDYATDTLATLDAATRLARGDGKQGDDELVGAWYERNKRRYDNSTQGRSFLMTTKVIGLLRARGAGGDFDEGKFNEWVRLSRGFTDGSISGKA